MPSKIIEIHRKPNFIQESNSGDADVQEYFGMAFKAIGSYWKEVGTVYATGMTRQEEDLLMPELLANLDPVKENREFRLKVQEFFKNINSKIPPEGMKLEIGLESEGPMTTKTDKGEIILSNPPLRLMDYIRYKHIVGHPHVAMNKDEGERYQHKQFYVVDKVKDTAGKSVLRDAEDAAQREYLSINKDLKKSEMVLTLLGVNTKLMNNDNLLLELKAQASIDVDAGDDNNLSRLKKFVDIVNDKELAAKYDIMEMVKYGILDRIRTKVLIKESNETIGENLREAVDWLLDKSNSKQVNSMYANLDALGKDRRIKHNSPHLPGLEDTKKPIITAPIE